jgi:hypothetical protein
MANIVIISDTNNIHVEFNDLASSVGCLSLSCPKTALKAVLLLNDHVDVYTDLVHYRLQEWSLTVSPLEGCLQVDLVDGVAPTSLSDLKNLLSSLML